jgi:hypothetical protein
MPKIKMLKRSSAASLFLKARYPNSLVPPSITAQSTVAAIPLPLPVWQPRPFGRLRATAPGRMLHFQPDQRATMKSHPLSRTLGLGSLAVFSAAVIFAPALRAQSQDNAPSVAEAARKAREQKKTAPKQSHVITDDTLTFPPASADTGASPPPGTVINTTPVMPSTETPPSPKDASAEPAKPAESSAPAPADAKKAEEQAAEIAKAKEMLAQLQSELDLLKRQLALNSETYYSNPDYARDTNGKAKLDDLQKAIGDKQISVQELKQQLEELLQKAGVSPDANDAPAPPKN